jgi:hypothetical protein
MTSISSTPQARQTFAHTSSAERYISRLIVISGFSDRKHTQMDADTDLTSAVESSLQSTRPDNHTLNVLRGKVNASADRYVHEIYSAFII